MNNIIIANNKKDLFALIKSHIKMYGNECDLNHIDVSGITDMSEIFFNSDFNGNISDWNMINAITTDSMFAKSKFNGDISKWDVSNVENMEWMFAESQFNKDISTWNVSNVKDMSSMFSSSQFDKDISSWNVSNVEYMMFTFERAIFSKDLKNWTPSKLNNSVSMFEYCDAPLPYWADLSSNMEIREVIDKYKLHNKLTEKIVETVKKEYNKNKI